MQLEYKIRERLADPRGRAIVLGLGISNIPLCRVLLKLAPAKKIIIRDKKPREELKNIPEGLEDACFITGVEPTEGVCKDADMSRAIIFRSPGIRPDAPDLKEAVRQGALLTSEMEWFCDSTTADIFTITGSDGKTTTTTLTHLLLSDTQHRSFVGGNIGTPLIEQVRDMNHHDCAVLELSSFQLFTMRGPAKRACITNITPNHLNWHKDMEEYTESKYNVFGNKTELLVLNAKNELSAYAAKLFRGHVTFFTAHNTEKENFSTLTGGRRDSDLLYLRGDDIVFTDGVHEKVLLSRKDIKLPGLHNVENYMAAIALTKGYVGQKTILNVAREFGGVEHRFELVRELNGVRYYNSSIDSSPTRTIAALSNLDCRPVVICGGRDKHVPFDPLAEALYMKASAVVLTGEAAPQIEAALEAYAAEHPETQNSLRILKVEDFDEAVRTASKEAVPGSAVILSPACTSFDRFANFEERGKHFKDLVNSL